MWTIMCIMSPHDSPPVLGVYCAETNQSQFSSHRPFSSPVSLEALISSRTSGSRGDFDGFVVSHRTPHAERGAGDFFFQPDAK